MPLFLGDKGLQERRLLHRPRRGLGQPAARLAQARLRPQPGDRVRRRPLPPARPARQPPAQVGRPDRQDARRRLRRHPGRGHASQAGACAGSCTRSPRTTRPTRSTACRARAGRPACPRPAPRSCWPGGMAPGPGVFAPEQIDPAPFLELMTAHGTPWGVRRPAAGRGAARLRAVVTRPAACSGAGTRAGTPLRRCRSLDRSRSRSPDEDRALRSCSRLFGGAGLWIDLAVEVRTRSRSFLSCASWCLLVAPATARRVMVSERLTSVATYPQRYPGPTTRGRGTRLRPHGRRIDSGADG